MEKITKDWTIGQVLKIDPGTAEIFKRYGIDCLGCPGASLETIAFGAMMHGLDAEKLVRELNEQLTKPVEPKDT